MLKMLREAKRILEEEIWDKYIYSETPKNAKLEINEAIQKIEKAYTILEEWGYEEGPHKRRPMMSKKEKEQLDLAAETLTILSNKLYIIATDLHKRKCQILGTAVELPKDDSLKPDGAGIIGKLRDSMEQIEESLELLIQVRNEL